MRSYLILNQKKVYYSDQGSGFPIILVHGYLESLEIWNDFALELSRHYRVICFDLPGHGKSQELTDSHTMELLAETISNFLNKLDIQKCFMIGHSMGGYVTLMFHKLFPESLSGFSLFHSHPFADSLETKNKRLREIKFITGGKKDLIAKYNIPNAFANDNLEEFKISVQKAIHIAMQTSEKGIIANLHAMMNRPDLVGSLEKTEIPFLFLLGKKDNYIDFNSIITKVKLPSNSQLAILENSGHMGFIEEKERSVNFLIDFIKNKLSPVG